MLELASLVFLLAAIFGWLSVRVLRLPSTIGTMVLTSVGALVTLLLRHIFPVQAGDALAMIAHLDFERALLHGLLPLLLFAGAFLLDLKYVFRQKLAIGALAVFGTIFAALLMAWLAWVCAPLFHIHASLLECFLFGALLSPTDPIAVIEMLRRVAAPRSYRAQLAGESLFNDGIGAVLFVTAETAIRQHEVSIGHAALLLVTQSAGAIALATALAWLCSMLMRTVRGFHIEILLTIALALTGYTAALHLHLAAPLEAVSAGIALRWFNARTPTESIEHERLGRFWRAADEVQNAVLFVLLGAEVALVPFARNTVLFGVLAIVLVTVVRFASVAASAGLVRAAQPFHRVPVLLLTWGGLRGGLTIALALAVPVASARAWMLPAAYIVVLFSIVLQGGTMDLYLRRSGLTRGAAEAPDNAALIP